MVVRGEKVQFDFVLQDWKRRLVSPRGFADYCVAYVGAERIECGADVHGHFSFSHIFDRYRPGDVVAIRAAAFQQRGSRDYMKIAGQWMHNDSPYELPDRKGVSDSITLTVYESPIELAVATTGTPLDPDTAVLWIRKSPDSAASILIKRPDRPGFSLGGPEKNGSYLLSYMPCSDELNVFGSTEIEFTARDVAGLAELDQSQQKVFGADVVVIKPVGLLASECQHLLGSGSKIVHNKSRMGWENWVETRLRLIH